jgi:hypothetical protein
VAEAVEAAEAVEEAIDPLLEEIHQQCAELAVMRGLHQAVRVRRVTTFSHS